MKRIVFFIIFIGIFLLPDCTAKAQHVAPVKSGSKAFFDSLDNRINYLQNQLPRLMQSRDVAYYNIKRELDLTLFVKAYEEFVADEDLFEAKDLVESRLERAKYRKDQYAIDFYNRYKQKVYSQIKQQRMYYQQLFAKEKNFKKVFDADIKPGNIESFQKARQLIERSLKYADENKFTETQKYLKRYLAYTEALIYDYHSPYDLKNLTASTKKFAKVFKPLVESDSLADMLKADTLVKHCLDYTILTRAAVDSDFFSKQQVVVANAILDYKYRQGRAIKEYDVNDQAIEAKMDTLNPRGVYKWHEHIIVIDEFIPTSSFENVKKGEAIIDADNRLADYLKKNKLCASIEDLRLGYAFVIPYKSTVKNSSFYFNPATQKWQYVACYSIINNENYTKEVSKFMPPLTFKGENDLVEQKQ